MDENDHEPDDAPTPEQAVRDAIAEHDEGDGVPRGAIRGYAALRDGVSNPNASGAIDNLERLGEIYEAEDGYRLTSADAPETGADAVASGLGLAAVRTLVERADDPRRETFDAVDDETLSVALRKGAIRETDDGVLELTPAETLAEAETYAEARGDEPTPCELRESETTDVNTHANGNALQRQAIDHGEPSVAPGTLRFLKGMVEARDGATRARLVDDSPYDADTTEDALDDLLERGELLAAAGKIRTVSTSDE
ncbi:hypothetical protein HrrHc1_260 [Halorubrum phage Hardycor1]|nr:hypothetical protein HrrHc1_260 [Halorubrum phage Hardycor1]